MTNSTPDQDATAETQAPTPTPASGDAGEVEAVTPDQAESPEQADPQEIPDNEDLEEPSTEKDPGEEPKAPSRDEPELDHEAIGIGVDEPPTV